MDAGIPVSAAQAIIEAGRRMDARGWVPATAGNLSVRLGDGRIAITRSGFHKGMLSPEALMLVDAQGMALDSNHRPSAETGLHCGIYRHFPEAGAALHGHSVPATVLSRRAGAGITLAGYELLKAFPGLATHQAAVQLPVLDNDQDIAALQDRVQAIWAATRQPVPGYLIRGHGVYAWGRDMGEALLRLEALEFMLDCELHERSLP